ncbi:hypothetical protein LCGC14_0866500 [marine sediment metagenome]|uniref:Uncharacterized protein n=1 Tax=marine sediment metagenome TaxID=412755 RepID=A0A0F9RQI3_9ZZZZ
MKDLSLKFLTLIVLVFGLWLSGVFIAAIWSDDIDSKNSIIEPNEPNEPIPELINIVKEVLDHEGRLIDVIGVCIERIEKLEESHLQMIPTWPDYIELEKDIYFDIHDQNAPDGMWKKVRWPLPKGTKIYFKD